MSDTLSFDLRVGFDDFALQVAADIPLSGITALSGPSGSGKTTLLRAIAGLERHVQGHVQFADEDWTGRAAAARGIGYVFQDARLFPHLDVLGNLAYGAARRGTSKAQVEAVIDALDLAPLLHRQPATLSGGETRRVALGRALASGPRILLMDEPLTGLDRERKARLMPYIARAVAGFGVPALYVTHSATEIGFLADRTLTISEGRLTGWAGAAPRLIGQVVNVSPMQVQLDIGAARVWVDGQGVPGEIWALPLGQEFVVSLNDPGPSNAALTVQGQVSEEPMADGRCPVRIAGQTLALPWHDAAAPAAGASVWVSLPTVSARPVQADPDVFDSQ